MDKPSVPSLVTLIPLFKAYQKWDFAFLISVESFFFLKQTATHINKNSLHEASCIHSPVIAILRILISVYREEQEGKNSFFSTMASIRSE